MALLPGSPAIDAGSNTLAVDANGHPLTSDQRGAGFPRVVNGTVDIGAYEFSSLISQTISFGPLKGQTYGVAPITLSATDTSGLPVSFSVFSGPATLSGSVLTVTGMGNVVVEASQAGNGTYAAATPVDESFTVAPALLTITANNDSKTYGTLKTFSGTAFTKSGLVNGDTITNVKETSTGAPALTTVGTYPIVPSATANGLSNYTIGYVNGTLPSTGTVDHHGQQRDQGLRAWCLCWRRVTVALSTETRRRPDHPPTLATTATARATCAQVAIQSPPQGLAIRLHDHLCARHADDHRSASDYHGQQCGQGLWRCIAGSDGRATAVWSTAIRRRA